MPPPHPESGLREWAERWSAAGRAIEAIDRSELRRLDTRVALTQLADAFEYALDQAAVQTTSGLVEQQRRFRRLRS